MSTEQRTGGTWAVIAPVRSNDITEGVVAPVALEGWRASVQDAGYEPDGIPTIERQDEIYPGQLAEQYGEGVKWLLHVRGRVRPSEPS